MCYFHHLYAHLLGDICESDYTLLLDSEWHEPEEINPSKATDPRVKEILRRIKSTKSERIHCEEFFNT